MRERETVREVTETEKCVCVCVCVCGDEKDVE